MKTVTLQIATRDEVKRRAQAAFAGRKQGSHKTEDGLILFPFEAIRVDVVLRAA